MRSARMRFRLRILKPEARVDAFKSKTVTYSETTVTWAERVKTTPRYGVEADELFSDQITEFNIRAYHEVKANWRVEDSDGVLYTVANVIPNIPKGIKTLRCEKVNL
ncbi:MAG: head-tail adaptor protein [Muribaculaceae bacterium]|nr:head-tail adaptor protein [Muribaculaceae bacterium]